MNLNIDQILEQGIAAHKKKEFKLAESLYREILEDKPSHPDANHNLGILLASSNKPTEALPLFKKATQNNTTIKQYWVSYINFLIQQKKFVDAELVSRKALEFHPKSSLINFNFGSILYLLKRLDEASINFKKAIELKPDYAEAYHNLANILYQQDKFKEAEVNYKRALELKPDFIEVYNNLGNTLIELNKFDEAEKIYRKAIELKPDYADVYNNLANLLYQQDKLEAAEINHKKAVELKPVNAEFFNNLAITVRKLKRLDEAVVLFTKAIELKPFSEKTYHNLALTLQLMGRLDESKVYFKKAIEVNSDFLMIINYINMGDWINSKKSLENFCVQKILSIKTINSVFIDEWCKYCYKILKQNDIKKFIKIFVRLFFIYERDQTLNNLSKFLYQNHNIKTILELTELDDKILVNVSYSKYKFMTKDFLLAEELAASNIKAASNLMNNPNTEDLGLFIVRISLTQCKNKIFARKSLNDFIINSKLNR